MTAAIPSLRARLDPRVRRLRARIVTRPDVDLGHVAELTFAAGWRCYGDTPDEARDRLVHAIALCVDVAERTLDELAERAEERDR
jgi:predicted RNase H-like HicB family nuclease